MISYTSEAKFALLDVGTSNWGAVVNAMLTQLDQGLILSFTAEENITEFDAVYISSDSKVKKADADDAAKQPCIGISLQTVSVDDSVKVLVLGWIDYDDSAHTALGATANDNIYLSATAGHLTKTPVDAHPQIIGIAKTDTATNVTRIFVFPILQSGEIVQQPHIEDVGEGSYADTLNNADAINEILAALEAVGILSSS